MGQLLTHYKCNCCSYNFKTGGISGFRYVKNEIKHFSLSSRQKQFEEGVDGISAIMYCRICDDVFEVILLEYKDRIYDYGVLFDESAELKKGYSYNTYKRILNTNSRGFYNDSFKVRNEFEKKESTVEKKQVCPNCYKASDLLLAARNFEMDCPRCKTGKIGIDHIDCFD